MDEIISKLPNGKTRRIASVFLPHMLDELNDVPEESVNEAAAFILLALARVQDPNAAMVLVDLTNHEVLAAEHVQHEEGGYIRARVANEFSQVPALPGFFGNGGSGDGSAATGS